MKPINQQTPVPLNIAGAPDVQAVAKALSDLALLPDNAALFAASYTAFDKAGRELNVDACELARSIDLVAVIRKATYLTYDVTLKGWQEDTIDSDDHIKWINAPSLAAIEAFVSKRHLHLHNKPYPVSGLRELNKGVNVEIDAEGNVMRGEWVLPESYLARFPA